VDRTDSTNNIDLQALSRAGRICQTDRIACVDLPAFPLQLLLRRHPDWRGEPAAVVAEDNPQAPLLWVSESARGVGVLPGMRYVAGLALDSGLRAAPVSAERIEAAAEALHRHLLRYSPRVEPAAHEPGVFWLDAGGLERVGGTPEAWAERLWRGLRRARFVCGVTVGYSRFGTYCLSRIHRRTAVLPSLEQEQAACREVALARLDLPPRVRDDLAQLGVRTVRDLVELPVTGLASRFGAETASLVMLARGLRFDPLQPVMPAAPYRAEEHLDQPESDAWRLLFLVKRLIHPLLARLAQECQAVVQLHLDLTSETHGPVQTVRESLRPAAPTLDVVLLTELVRRLLARSRPLLSGPPDMLRTGGAALVRAAVGSGRVGRADGPHLVSSGWWDREQRRAYHFVEADGGRLLWVYYDERERRWYLQGTVE